MKTNNGFTLIEVLFVLGILSIILLIIPPLNIANLEKLNEKQFLETFKSDVLYVQNYSTLVSNEKLNIEFNDDNYKVVSRGAKGTILKRDYPPGWSVGAYTDKIIEFKESGTFLNPRTITMTSKHAVYKVVFPLGKGRFYIVKE